MVCLKRTVPSAVLARLSANPRWSLSHSHNLITDILDVKRNTIVNIIALVHPSKHFASLADRSTHCALLSSYFFFAMLKLKTTNSRLWNKTTGRAMAEHLQNAQHNAHKHTHTHTEYIHLDQKEISPRRSVSMIDKGFICAFSDACA
jgi:hypothetical protein